MIDRRTVLKTGAFAAATLALPRGAAAAPSFAPEPGAWRTFEITTRIELPAGDARTWVPLPSVDETDWARSMPSRWTTNAPEARIEVDPVYGATFLHAGFPADVARPILEVTSRFQTRDRRVDLDGPGDTGAVLSADERRLYLAATDLIPTDGIVKETADRIVAGTSGEVEKARAIYDWVVDNTFRDAATRGCGTGDIAAMLRTGNLGGKCADLNALFVGLARAAGLPARDLYGIRVAPSRFGYRSLGTASEIVSKAQHCRAEVFLVGFGWVPADPADVRKVVLEEPPGKLSATDAKVVAARKALFGSSEGNWLAYNLAHDLALPGAAGPKLAFLMYPQAEIGRAALDCLDPDTFRYTIRASEVSV